MECKKLTCYSIKQVTLIHIVSSIKKEKVVEKFKVRTELMFRLVFRRTSCYLQPFVFGMCLKKKQR